MGLINLTGQRFGRLEVIGREEKQGYHPRWTVVCDCGEVFSVEGPSLRRGRTKSCGCLHLDVMTKHGMADTPEYVCWSSMLYRCYVPTCIAYRYYGALGVTVCDQWWWFEDFYEDMGPRPEGLSLDRIDPEGNYEPGNCRWADRITQSNNTRKKKLAKQK